MFGGSIRAARASDTGPVLNVLRTAFRPYRSEYTLTAYQATVLNATMLRRRLRSMSVLVALSGSGVVVGTIGVKTISRDQAHLRGMAVLPRYQGRGVAAALLRAAVRTARASGARRLTLETTAPLVRAERFYLRHGFRRTGRTRRWGGMRLIGFERRI